MDSIEFAVEMYREHAEQARRHEDQRGSAVTALVGLSLSALSAASGSREAVDTAWVGSIVLVLGGLGALLALKHYERSRRHGSYLASYRRAIEAALGGSVVAGPGATIRPTGVDPNLRFDAIRAAAKGDHEKTRVSRRLAWLRLHWLYTIANLLAIAAGLRLVL